MLNVWRSRLTWKEGSRQTKQVFVVDECINKVFEVMFSVLS